MSSSILTLDQDGMYVSFDRSHLFVVDCLPSSERSIRLKDDIQDIINASDIRSDTQYNGYVPQSIDDLFVHLEDVASQFEKFDQPNGLILHIEAHGRNFVDQTNDAGIEVGDGRDFITWVGLQPIFSRLYDATQGKLTLVVSACWGYAALASVVGALSARCAPFRYLIAPRHKATNEELEHFWRQFYQALYDDVKINEIINAHPNFSLLSIEQFLATYALGTGKEATNEEAQGRLATGGILMTLSAISEGREQHARRLIRKFLRIDQYPHLMKEMDMRSVGKILKDHDLLISNARDDDWTTSTESQSE